MVESIVSVCEDGVKENRVLKSRNLEHLINKCRQTGYENKEEIRRHRNKRSKKREDGERKSEYGVNVKG